MRTMSVANGLWKKRSQIAGACRHSRTVTVLLWRQAPAICERFFHKPFATDIVRIVSLSLPALAIGRVATAAGQGYGVMRYSAWLGIVRRALRLITLLPFIAVGLDAKTL